MELVGQKNIFGKFSTIFNSTALNSCWTNSKAWVWGLVDCASSAVVTLRQNSGWAAENVH